MRICASGWTLWPGGGYWRGPGSISYGTHWTRTMMALSSTKETFTPSQPVPSVVAPL